MFSSQRVLYLDSLFCYPIMFSVNHAAIFVWIFSPWFPYFLHSHTRSCLSQQPLSHRSALTTSWDVATRPLSVFSLRRRFRRCYLKALAYTAAQIVTSPHKRFWHDSLLPDGRHHHWLFDRTSGRLTVPSEPSSIANTAMHPHHRPSCILRAPHPSETHACRSPTTPSRSLPPSALQPRLYGASHLKTPSIITASSITSPHPRVHPAPHHRLLVSALFYRFPHIVHVLR